MRGLSAVATPRGGLGRPWRILLVEPDEGDRDALSADLIDLDCAVVGVGTPAEAVTLLVAQDQEFDAVVTDVHRDASVPVSAEAEPTVVPDDGPVPVVGVLCASGPAPVVVFTERTEQGIVEWALAEGAAAVVDRGEGAEGLLRAFAQTRPLQAHDLAPLPPGSADMAGTTDLSTMLRRVLETLQAHIPMGLWMLTRVEGDDWIVIDAVGDAYDIHAGSVLRWSDSFCSRMVRGQGTRVVNTVAEVPAYAEAPVGERIPIGCYLGMPIALQGRGLFGTLCAIDPTPAPKDLTGMQWMLELLAQTLSTALAIDLERTSLQRRLVQPGEHDIDGLTGLATRHTWNRLLRLEEARSARTGEHAAVIVFDVRGLGTVNQTQGNAAGDQLLRRAARVIDDSITINELGVRLGEGTFGVMAVGRPPADIDRLAEDLLAALADAGIDVVMGLASRGDGLTLGDASMLAIDLMLREKVRSRQAADSED